MHRRLDTLIYIVSAVFLIGAASIWWQGVRPGSPLVDQGQIRAGLGDLPSGSSSAPGVNQEPTDLGDSRDDSKEPATLVVHVGGAVKSPGVYQLREGQRVYEAVMLAGPLDDANLDLLNLAALLKDSQKIIVPKKGEQGSSGGQGSSLGPEAGLGSNDGYTSGSGYPSGGSGYAGGQPSFPLNINTASLSELESLPGIGPSLAAAIADYRTRFGPFRKIEDLKNVSGIGEKTFAKLAPLIVAE